ncbi:MAG: hypothetical protein AB7F19_07485 [Candidatus Babeliales bacterium]
MAPENLTPAERATRLNEKTQEKVVHFVQGILNAHKSTSIDIQNKMDAIDIAYARYTSAVAANSGGKDVSRDASVACDVFDTKDRVTPPIVVSQVDSYVGYLADVFLSGTPLFPVVSSPKNRIWAEQLETLLDDHAILGGYVRQLLMFLRDGVKYNYSAVELEWDAVQQFSVLADYKAENQQRVDRSERFFTRMKRLNPRNVIRDPNIPVGDISAEGDYAGYIEALSTVKLKRLLKKIAKNGEVYNWGKALSPMLDSSPGVLTNMRDDPQISDYVSTRSSWQTATDWERWFEGRHSSGRSISYGRMFEKVVVYARIIPADLDIKVPQPNTPQIWKFTTINGHCLIEAKRIISAYDQLPILFGQPVEDGLRDQTQSVAEGEIPFQEAAGTLFNIRFSAARRAVSDRALYDSSVIDPKQVNSKAAAPKIPVNFSALSNRTLDSVYKQIPFDMRGTETTIQDAQTIVNFSKELHGLNGPRQGSFQKGNKSVTEWNDTMAGSDNRLRLPAMTLECQVFTPMKNIMMLNIWQYGDNVQLVSQRSGEVLDIDINELRKHVMSFKMADGYTPKSKMASTEMISNGMTMIATSPILQQAYGPMLPAMFAHLMSLGGVKGLDEYSQPAQTAAALPQNVANNLVQSTVPQGGETQPPGILPQGNPLPAMPPAGPPLV